MIVPHVRVSGVALLALLAACGGNADTSARGGPSVDPVAGVRAAGTDCFTEGETVCALDANAAPTGGVLLCQTGKYAAAFSCATGQACKTQTGHRSVLCGDTTITQPGDLCAPNGIAACAPGLSAVTVCVEGKWLVAHRCAPAMCGFVKGADGVGRAQCGADDAYTLGDYCDFPPDRAVCSNDHAALLKCEAHQATLLKACPAGQKCAVSPVMGVDGIQCKLALSGLTAHGRTAARVG